MSANTNPWLGRLPTTLGLSIQSVQAARKDALNMPMQRVRLETEMRLVRNLRSDLLRYGRGTPN